MSKIPLPYTPKVLEIFRNPKNLGKIEDYSVVAEAGSPACGDVIRIYLKVEKVNEEDVIMAASFESYGCAANIASASILTELVKRMPLKEAWKIGWKRISDELGGLPSIKYHCSILAVGALKRAIRKYYENKERPDWLPKEETLEERQALELEKLLEKLYRRP